MKFRNSYLWMFTVASLAGLGEVRGQFPAEQTPAGQTDTIRIMTYNIHHGEGTDGVYDVERIGRFMREQKVDLVGLQEVERKFSQQSNFEDQPAILTALLDFHAYYAPNLKDSFGNLTLSRWEISKSRNVLLPDPDSEEQRGISIATIPVGDVTLTFLNTHLSWGSPRNQKLQFEMIRDMVRALPEPVIIVGDFNTVPYLARRGLRQQPPNTETQAGI